MRIPIAHLLLKILHVLCWCLAGFAILVVGTLCVLAIGFNGARFQHYLDAAIPESAGRLSVRHVAYWPGRGVVLKGIRFEDAEGKCLASAARVIADFRLFTHQAWQDRLQALEVDDLYVAQIEYDPNAPEDTLDTPHPPFPDFSDVVLPQFDGVDLIFRRPNVLEVELELLTGTLDTQGGALLFRELKGDVDGDQQSVDATITVDIHKGVVDAHIRGFVIQTRVNGVYRALNFPIIEEYSNNFTLKEPAWADCTFTVGFDKYRNIFSLRIDISAKAGDYCGVAFDEAQGTIRCNGIWDAVTVIEPLVARRNGKVVASGKLCFDCPKDRFEFEAEGQGLTPTEALQLIDMPFTDAIPAMTSEQPPEIAIRGHIPLLSEQTPEKVVLNGSVTSETPFTFDRITFDSVNTLLSMQRGIFSLDALHATLPLGGFIEGRVDIAIPDTAEYTDITAGVTIDDASLADLLQPFGMETLTGCVANGEVTLSCRTDDSFKSSLESEFDLVVNGGLIGRVPLFAGFTDIMANNIPGISTLTDTSTAHLDGTIRKGLLSIPEFALSGSLFMIEGPVTYNFPKDEIYAKIIAGVFKKNTFIGTLTRWATVPVTKMLWELEVTGPLAQPDWHNLTIVEKIWDHVPFFGGEQDATP